MCWDNQPSTMHHVPRCNDGRHCSGSWPQHEARHCVKCGHKLIQYSRPLQREVGTGPHLNRCGVQSTLGAPRGEGSRQMGREAQRLSEDSTCGESEVKQGAQHGPSGVRKVERGRGRSEQ